MTTKEDLGDDHLDYIKALGEDEYTRQGIKGKDFCPYSTEQEPDKYTQWFIGFAKAFLADDVK